MYIFIIGFLGLFGWRRKWTINMITAGGGRITCTSHSLAAVDLLGLEIRAKRPDWIAPDPQVSWPFSMFDRYRG